MKSIFYVFAMIFMLSFMSCKKDIDRKLVGTYKGTARLMKGTLSNPTRDKDTLYTEVTITVSEGTESTRKETKLTLAFAPSTIAASYNENMPVQDGTINFMRTNRGSAGTYYRWEGTIMSDSLNLKNNNEEGNGGVWQWEFKAARQ